MADPIKAPGQVELERLREGGFTIDEMNKWTLDTRAQLKAGGFTDNEIDLNYFGNRLTSNPRPIAQLGQNRLEGAQKAPTTMKEAFEVGFGWSTAHLGAEAVTGGVLPTQQITQDMPWNLRLAGNIGTLVGDAPALYAGGRIGGAPGAFMATAALRHLFIHALEHGEIKTKEEFIDLLTSTAWETAKGWAVGQVVGFAGKAATVTAAGAPAAVKLGVPAAAEATALVAASRGLEGELPSPQDWVDMGLLVFGFKGANAGTAKLRKIWAQTGVTPAQIGEDIKVDPKVWQDLVSDKPVPDKYAVLAENGNPPASRLGGTWWNESIRPRLKEAWADAQNAAPGESPLDTAKRMLLVFQGKQVPEGLLRPDRVIVSKVAEPPMPAVIRPKGKIPEPSGAIEPNVPKVTPELTPAVEPPVTEPKPAAPPKGTEPTLDAAAENRAKAFFERPFLDVPRGPDEPNRPPYSNLQYTKTPEEVKQSYDKLSQLFEQQITEARRGVVTNAESYKAAKGVFMELLGKPGKGFKLPGEAQALEQGDFTKLTANVYALKEIATRFAEELTQRREILVAKGANVTDMDRLEWIAAVETTGKHVSNFFGAKTELGRAMQMLQSVKRMNGAAQVEAVKNVLDEFGKTGDMDKLMKAVGEFKDPQKLLAFAEKASKATKWDMWMEAYRAALISGVTTAQVNLISTAGFGLMRVPIRSVAALFGAFHGGDKVVLGETVGASIGLWMGTKEAAIVTAAVAKHGLQTAMDSGPIAGGAEMLAAMEAGAAKVTGKSAGEGRQNAIPGALGHVVRAPFLALSLPDLYLKTVNSRAELYSLAARDASLNQNLRFGTSEYWQHVTDFVNEPPPEALDAAQKAGLRNTFNAPPGAMSGALGQFMKQWYLLQMAVPFRRTIGNIFKEGARMTPGLNLAVGEWRDDFSAGGARRDMALAELTVGGLIMFSAYLAASQGNVTGGGSPDRGQKPVDRAAGWSPYALKLGDKFVPGYQRMAPYGQLIGMVADAYEIKQYMTQDEHDQLLRMLGTAFAQNVTNQTFMQGVTGIVNVVGDPQTNGENYLEQLAGTAVPSFLGQMAREKDPLIREVEGIFEGVQSRIPGWREGLRPKIDLFGEPIKNPEHLWYGSPFVVTQIAGDKVRTEASRIGFASAPTPKDVSLYTGLPGEKDLNSVKLTPAQRDIFAVESGHLAHKVLEAFVNSKGWDATPDLYKRQVYHGVFEAARSYGAMKALSPQERVESETDAVRRIIQQLQQ